MSESDKRIQSLAVFIELEKRIRDCKDRLSLAFTLVNETHSLVAYRQAVLWQPRDKLTDQILAVSGLAVPDATAPYSVWVRQLAKSVHQLRGDQASIYRIPRQAIPADVSQEWSNWFPEAALWLPIVDHEGRLAAALILAKDTEWRDSDSALLGYLGNAVSHAWQALENRSQSRVRLRRIGFFGKRWWLPALLILAISVIPVHQTTLSPAEVIPKDPVMIRAGIEGVIEQIAVEPNQQVTQGQTLVTLDATQLGNQLEVARKALEVADAEYRQAAQTGVFDNRANANLAILQGRAEQHVSEVRYLESMLSRVTISAPSDGVAVYTDPSEWEGRPVSIGERIMLLANPNSTEIEIQLPVADVIAMEAGARVRLFLNVDPHNPIEGTVRFANYQATLTPENTLAYRVVADFAEPVSPRIGLKGTAKLYGDRTLLILYVLRRPLASLRQMTGF